MNNPRYIYADCQAIFHEIEELKRNDDVNFRVNKFNDEIVINHISQLPTESFRWERHQVGTGYLHFSELKEVIITDEKFLGSDSDKNIGKVKCDFDEAIIRIYEEKVEHDTNGNKILFIKGKFIGKVTIETSKLKSEIKEDGSTDNKIVEDIPEPLFIEEKKSILEQLKDTNTGCLSRLFSFLGVLILLSILAFLLKSPWLLLVLLLLFFGSEFTWILFLLLLLSLILNGGYKLWEDWNIDKTRKNDYDQTRRVKEENENNTVKLDSVSQKRDFDDTTTRVLNDRVVHRLLWNDYKEKLYTGDWIGYRKDYEKSKQNIESFQPNQNGNNISYFNSIYKSALIHDEPYMNEIYKMYDSISKANNLDQTQFAEMVVTSIQEIPYVLVLENSADVSNSEYWKYKNQGLILDHIKFGVQTPIEFTYNLKGDCDTRSLLAFAILNHFKVKCAILLSNAYKHAMLGVVLPSRGANLNYKGENVYFWETTAKGCEKGYLNPQMRNLNLWTICLTNF
jgi:hypothetical protein